MAEVFVKILYPREGAAIPPDGCCVYGICEQGATVTANLFVPGQQQPIQMVEPATPLPDAYDWGLKYDMNPLLAHKLLRVEVTASKAALPDGHDVRLFHTRPKDGGYGGPSITVAYPVNHVPRTFTALGYVDPTGCTMTAWIQPSGGGGLTYGAPVFPPPSPYDWAFQFTLPIGFTSGILIVQGVSGTGTSSAAVDIVTP
jgi:hypothetical protein